MGYFVTQNVILEQTAEKSQASLGEIVPSSRGPLKVKGKKIWIDLDNSPHVPFFIPIIEELEKLGCEILLTARDTYQVCDLLKFHKLPCRVIGGNYGKNKIFKVLGNCIRSAQLLPTAFKGRPDLAISHGSRAQVLVCTGLGIPTIMMHDYEFTTKTGFLEPTWTLMPDVIPSSVMSKRPERVLKYPGLKEDVYVPSFHPDPSIFNSFGNFPGRFRSLSGRQPPKRTIIIQKARSFLRPQLSCLQAGLMFAWLRCREAQSKPRNFGRTGTA